MSRPPLRAAVKFSDTCAHEERTWPAHYSGRRRCLTVLLAAAVSIAGTPFAIAQQTDQERRRLEREGQQRLERREERRERDAEKLNRQRLDNRYRTQEERRLEWQRRHQQMQPSEPREPPQRH